MASKMLQVRKEYGESFQEVVKGFAEMGYSRSRVAETLEFNLSYFRELCTRFDLHKHFKQQGEMRVECRRGFGSKGWPKGKPRPYRPRYSDEDILKEVAIYDVSTLFQSMSDINISTVHRRFGSWQQAKEKANSMSLEAS